MSAGNEFESKDKEEIAKEIYLEIKRLKNQRLTKVKKDFEGQIRQAENENDREKVKSLIRQFQKDVIKKLPGDANE
jgi:hypothetical protein